MDDAEKLARRRFNTLNMVRFFGVATALLGAANIGGKLLPDFAPWLGFILIVNGAVDVLLLPALLKKKWARGA